MHHGHHRLAYTAIACAILLGIGLVALNFPVFIDAFDKWGFQIKCGTGYVSDLSQAAAAGAVHVDQCGTALLVRRLWTIALVAVSGLVLLAIAVAAAVTSTRESLMPHRDTA